MVCAWEDLLKILPPWMRKSVGNLESSTLQELRLRLDSPPELIFKEEREWLKQPVRREDISFCINAASQYSPWASVTLRDGYITAHGGHRIGICGDSILKEDGYSGIREVRSICLRVARDISGIAESLSELQGSILILGAPGWGKTTLLRDLICYRSRQETVVVVDERGELFPSSFSSGPQTDILTGCPKPIGISMVLRSMGPQTIALDEITDERDCKALLEASFCGVSLLATAHACSISQFLGRTIYRSLAENVVFDYVVMLKKNQTYEVERIQL